MATVFSPNVIEIAVKQTYAGRPAVNVWHMFFSPEASARTKADVVDDFANNWRQHVLDLQSNDVTIQSFDWRSLDTDGEMGSLSVTAGSPDSAGARAGAGAPPNVAMLIKKNTSDRARGQRDGRMFLVGITESEIDEAGVISGAAVTTYQAAIDAFYNGISDTAWDASGDRYPVVLATTPESRAPGPQSVTIDSRRITSLSVDTLVSTQRDRLR